MAIIELTHYDGKMSLDASSDDNQAVSINGMTRDFIFYLTEGHTNPIRIKKLLRTTMKRHHCMIHIHFNKGNSSKKRSSLPWIQTIIVNKRGNQLLFRAWLISVVGCIRYGGLNDWTSGSVGKICQIPPQSALPPQDTFHFFPLALSLSLFPPWSSKSSFQS